MHGCHGNCSSGLYVYAEYHIVEGTGIMQIQPKSGLLPEAFFLVANMLPWQPY